ncbi:MAG: PGF-pre-PGF domain-containing protein [Candidatus Aenigmatarchaeota archaeon]|nr:MAG: PGF-pre-PGF domain-containing protein [Candidatus Aenigmarchaeota archaeon]
MGNIKAIVLFTAVLTLILLGGAHNVAAQEVYLTPAGSIDLGQELVLRIRVTGVTDLSGFQIDLSYDPSVLSYTRTEEGTFLNSDGATTYSNLTTITVDTDTGMISDIIVFRYSSVGIGGDGILASVYFDTPVEGTSDIKLEQVLLSNSTAGEIHEIDTNTTIAVVSSGGVIPPDGDGGGGGGRGGTPGSPSIVVVAPEEPEEFQEGMTLIPGVVTVLKGTAIGLGTGLEEIHINVNKVVQGVKVNVDKFEAWPSPVTAPGDKIIYRHLDIITENLEAGIESVKVMINVEKSWLSDNLLEQDDVIISKYDSALNSWEDLETTFLTEDGTYYYYEAELDSLDGYLSLGGNIQEESVSAIVEKSILRFIKQNDELIFIASMSLAIFLILLIISLKTILKGAKLKDFTRFY